MSEWVNVKDKTPETGYELNGNIVSDSVLICGKCIAGYFGIGTGHYEDVGSWICYEGEFDNQNIIEVTHWMPLPKPPK